MRLTIRAAITADVARRTLVGTLYRYGEVGSTSAGELAVGPSMPPPPIGLPLTAEHDRAIVRGSLALVDNTDERLRIAARVVDGELGDQALAEAVTRKRAAFSLDIEDAEVVDGVIVSGRWEAVGQVENPAFNSARIDSIAASTTPGEPMLTEAQRARLIELLALPTPNDTEAAELTALLSLANGDTPPDAAEATAPAAAAPAATETTAAASGQAVAASLPAVPGGVPGPAGAATTQPRGGALAAYVADLVAAMQPGGGGPRSVTAALADITYSAHNNVINPPAWSGELWSGLSYEPLWVDLFNSGELTNMRGAGWRFVTKLVMQDYAGNKVEIPTSTVTTEASNWAAARLAVGVDIDRAYFDFPNEGFLQGLFEQARESSEMVMDGKVRAYTLANAVPAEGVDPAPSLIKAAAFAVRALRRRRVVGRNGSAWVMTNDDDLMSLLDYNELTLPKFLELWGIKPENFRSSQDVPEGTVLAGVKQAGTLRRLPVSPLRVEAQNLTKGGIDEAFFQYWAMEEHHTAGIASAEYEAPVVPDEA